MASWTECAEQSSKTATNTSWCVSCTPGEQSVVGSNPIQGSSSFFLGKRTAWGEFHDGVMHGVGRFTWTDGLVYEGEMERSKITGRGTYTWPDESTYSGGVVNGIRHGYGVYYSPVTRTTYSGHWVNGKREGKWTFGDECT
ncbi:Radial spoke head 10 homolog B [Geodia barretti]|uniref:Radial spoke head 10 homolog B n=1 Tax=Geodia barretti TaxID=519541 RepID=A0AA35S7H5_GEOBA|nr:Radial spoke head 10 homolog B [Geodia barretti]